MLDVRLTDLASSGGCAAKYSAARLERLLAGFAPADAENLLIGLSPADDEPKYGLAVVGTVHPQGVWPKSGAQPGDALFLTKPLGTGLVLTGCKKGHLGDVELGTAVGIMRTLNRDATDAIRPFAPNAATDVTGFGLAGHAYEMAERSGVAIRLRADQLPALPGALDVARAGLRTAGAVRNREYAGDHVESDG